LHPGKCFSFRVTTVNPWLLAMPPIRQIFQNRHGGTPSFCSGLHEPSTGFCPRCKWSSYGKFPTLAAAVKDLLRNWRRNPLWQPHLCIGLYDLAQRPGVRRSSAAFRGPTSEPPLCIGPIHHSFVHEHSLSCSAGRVGAFKMFALVQERKARISEAGNPFPGPPPLL
jgi:hypothetical protein